MLRRIALLLTLVLVFGVLALTSWFSSRGQLLTSNHECKTFRETGKTLCGNFLNYWQQEGSERKFGKPVSNPFAENVEQIREFPLVQYFEKAVFKAMSLSPSATDVMHETSSLDEYLRKYPKGEPGEPYVENLPRYPDAQNLSITHGNNKGLEPDISMSYITEATPDELLAFYKEVMPKNGWFCTWSCQELENPKLTGVSFDYVPTDDPLLLRPTYTLHVIITTISRVKSRVELQLLIIGPG